MNIGAAFPSKYLKAADLSGKRINVIIDRVELEDIGDDSNKAVLYFQGKEKGLVLNKTNANMIVEITGTEETTQWKGTPICLYSTKVDYQGKRIDAIRVDVSPNTPAKAAKASPEPESEFNDDDIPF